MIAAIYARKSTDEPGRAETQKSVTRQKELARKFAASKGWTVDDRFVFQDDGISGAEFERRPGYQRLMHLLHPRPPFGVLVVSEQKSLGRESFETNYAIKQLAEAGVQIFEYVQGQLLNPRNALDKAMRSLQGFGDELHREQTSQRTHEGHAQRARLGLCVGGRVFGYRNVDVTNGFDAQGRPRKSHVDREVFEPEALVVRRIFELYDGGLGLKAIAKQLNREGALSPTPFVRRSEQIPAPVRGWAPSTVRTVLRREIYRGVVVWNRTRKRTEVWGKVDQRPRPASDWIRAERPDLRIIDDQLWTRVGSRRAETESRALRFESGRISGRPPKHAVKNLLAGVATCGVCGGGLVVETSGRKERRVPQYVCHRHGRGDRCTNALRVEVDVMNEAVLQAVEEHALTPEAVEQVIALTSRTTVSCGCERSTVRRRTSTGG